MPGVELLPEVQKSRGAYYTDPVVAAFLVRWAARSSADRILEPCFGGGVFLRAAVKRIAALGGDPKASVVAVEMDSAVHRAMRKSFGREELAPGALFEADFFTLDASRIGFFNCAVGNPPFIRYQRFNGQKRTLALKRAAAAGADIPALTSAWAPFLVHTSTFLKRGGRLAMVAPAELCHATYARPVLRFLRDRFQLVRILTFERKLFPEISEDTVLVLAEGYGEPGSELRLVSLKDASALKDDPFEVDGVPILSDDNGIEVNRPILYLLPGETREIYRRLTKSCQSVIRMKTIATSGIGYVTGNNDFFHLTATETRTLRLSPSLQSRAVCRAGWLAGLSFTERDWVKLDSEGFRTRLLRLSPSYRPRPTSLVGRYLRAGVRKKVNHAYKCRVRDPWYAVPHVQVPDLFLTYMANVRPALVVNEAGAVAPNTLLCLRLKSGTVAPNALAAGWWTSLTALGAEIEGHSLGGGMLKLEPREAANIPLPIPALLHDRRETRRLADELDGLLRTGDVEAALDLGDREILQAGLGLSAAECLLLRQSYRILSERRLRR